MDVMQTTQTIIFLIFILFCIRLYFSAKKKLKNTDSKTEIETAKFEKKIGLIMGISFIIFFFVSFFI